MGAAASAGVDAHLKTSSPEQIKQILSKMSDAERAKIAAALPSLDSSAKPEASEAALTKSEKPAPSAAKSEAAPAKADQKNADQPQEEWVGDIPPDWGWPKEPFEPEELKEYVKEATKNTRNEDWHKQLADRTEGESIQDFVAEKAFANVCLNKEGTGEEKADQGQDPNAYIAGKWYRFLNANEDCYVYVHNYTRDITATRPPNFKELTDEEKKRLKQLGTYIKELPSKIESVYVKTKCIPIILGTPETCEALKNFYIYDKDGELCDTSKLKRVNQKALEDCRKAIVNAMKHGKTLCVYLGDTIPDFNEKVCTAKNRKFFPEALFRYGALDTDMVKENIYTEDDKESGQCVVRPGFKVCLVLMYDSMGFNMSSFRKEEMQNIPHVDQMEQVRTYNEDDKKKFLDLLKSGQLDQK